MKRLTYSLAAKTAAVILSFVLAVLTAGCVFAGGVFFVFFTHLRVPGDRRGGVLWVVGWGDEKK